MLPVGMYYKKTSTPASNNLFRYSTMDIEEIRNWNNSSQIRLVACHQRNKNHTQS